MKNNKENIQSMNPFPAPMRAPVELPNKKGVKQILNSLANDLYHLSNHEVQLGLKEAVEMLEEAEDLVNYLEEIYGDNSTKTEVCNLLK